MSIATAAKQIVHDGMTVAVGGGVEHISLVQNEHQNGYRAQDPNLIKMHKDIYMPMLQTAEVVAKRYNISRDAQDEYGLQSQQRTAAAQEAGLYDDEIVEVTAMMKHVDKATGKEAMEEKTLKLDEGNRPSTTLEGLQSLKPVFEGGCITAGNTQLVATVDHLHGKRFVELPDTNIIHGQAMLFQQFRYGKYRANAHFIGLATGDSDTAVDT